MRKYCFFVYILASRKKGTIYIGVTNNLARRVLEHKNDLIEGFTKDYKVHDLVHYEETDSVDVAITREKQLKKWKREWKVKLIEENNPLWEDLYKKII